MQTTPATLTNPTYLASAGIQLGPGTDLVTKTAGLKAASVYVYPTTVFYGLRGNIKNATESTGYLWPGNAPFVNGTAGQDIPYPDISSTPAYYRIQQPCILLGMSLSLTIVPVTGNFQIKVRVTPSGGTIADVPSYTHTFTVGSPAMYSYYSSSANFNTGDYIHVQVIYTSTDCHDLTVQLNLF